MRKTIYATLLALLGVSAQAGEATFDFTNDPIDILEIGGNGSNPQEWVETGGNPGGFLAITWPTGGQTSSMVFPDIDDGGIITAFKFEADLRIGNSTGDRAADGFSISIARENDPLFEDPGNQGLFAGGIMEGGSTTGIAISFDTWSGNTYSDGGDIEGILVRVDDKTVLRHSVPTRHGDCEDATSLQTGPRDPEFWDLGGDFLEPESWATLCWQPLIVELNDSAQLTVIWKGATLLDNFQTDFFPSAGRLVLAGRTGGANEHTHIDNIKLTTSAGGDDSTPPTNVSNLAASNAGARFVSIAWDEATDDSGRVGYELEIDGGTPQLVGVNEFTDTGLNPGTSHTYRVRALDISGNASDWQSVTATTGAEEEVVGFLLGEIYDNIPGVDVESVLFSDGYFDGIVDRGVYLNGLSFNVNPGGDFGSDYGIVIKGVLTAPETGQFDFFVRSDDGSQFFLNESGAAAPDPVLDLWIAEETGCCNAFQEVGALQTTQVPISLTAGREYGFTFVVSEGGGGDWGEVAMRKVGDTTPANQLAPIRGELLKGMGDPTGADLAITSQPANTFGEEGSFATIDVEVDVTSPYDVGSWFQWSKDGQPIIGGTRQTLVVRDLTSADEGSYSVKIGTMGKTLESSAATLTVVPPGQLPGEELLLSDGLVAHWGFDGDLTDSVGSLDGEAQGPVGFEAGQAGFGQAISLDGTGFVEILDSAELDFAGGSMSISGWFTVGTFDKSWQALIAKGEQSAYRVARRGGGAAIAYAGGVGEGADDAPAVDDGGWHHFVAVSDANAIQFGTAIYIDGVRYGDQATAPVLEAEATNLYIGENPEALNRQWIGQIDDIGIWDRVLSESEVSEIYNGGAGTPIGGLPMGAADITGFWDFNDGLPAGSEVAGNSEHGATEGVDGSGALVITRAENSQLGGFLSGPIGTVDNITIDFDIYIADGNNPMADGISMAISDDLEPVTAFSETGTGSKLRINFDNWDNGGGEAPAIDVAWGGTEIASVPMGSQEASGLDTDGWWPVHIELTSDGAVTILYNGELVHAGVNVPDFSPIENARIAFGGRTGGANANQWIDNFSYTIKGGGGGGGINTDGLVAYWGFDGDLTDSVGSLDGTAQGAVGFEAGQAGFGQAISLDGSSFVEIMDSSELDFAGGSMSIAGWFTVGSFDKSWQALIAKGEQSAYRVARRGGGGAIAYAGGVGEGADDAPAVDDGGWHHFVAVSDANAIEFGTAIYIDGAMYGVQATAPVLEAETTNLYIGENPEALNRQWIGLIDDISIWDRVLGADEVSALYNGGAGVALSTSVGGGGGGGGGSAISISRSATGVTVTFEGTLQSSDSVTGPYTDVAGATSPADIPLSGAAQFFRSSQ